jgi:ABC-type transport system involved in multi-copper enzyme maturation permease subunit
MSVFAVRVIDYQKQINQYLADVQQADEVMQSPTNYSHINPRAIHQPLIFSIYNQGFQFNRVVHIRVYEAIETSITQNEENNPLFRENSQLDITFLITFFLSLFILLISYDSVNGEKRTGTLRILMTYPIKRQSFILKKILGVFVFVAFTFSIPYTLSLLCLVFIYANLLTTSFFLSAFFYWFLVLLFIFFFCLVGILISVLTTNPNRSLVYSLLSWIMLCIILPISWDYIASPKLFNDELVLLRQINTDKRSEAQKTITGVDTGGSYLFYNGQRTHNVEICSFQGVYEKWYHYQSILYESYFPANRETELAVDNVIRKRINIDNIKSMVFFFNPVVLFSDIGARIAGNSRADYLRFLHEGRAIRDELVNLGIREGWLLDYRFFARYADEFLLGADDYWIEKIYVDWESAYEEIFAIMEDAEMFSFEMPFIRRYEQPNPSFSEIFTRIATVLAMFVVSILALWICTWMKFMRYDVR